MEIKEKNQTGTEGKYYEIVLVGVKYFDPQA